MSDPKRRLAIGDIHGCSKTFRKLLFDVLDIQPTDEIYCIGDYVDRGPDSKGVIDTILEMRDQGYQIQTLRGNHEQIMMESDTDDQQFDLWINNGGEATLESFGVVSYSNMQSHYRKFFAETQYYIAVGNCILVHAGLNFGRDDIFEDRQAMLWIRNFDVDPDKLGEKVIIHGHTPQPADVIFSQVSDNVINIDGGCVYTHRPGFGYLFAIDMQLKTFFCTNNIDC